VERDLELLSELVECDEAPSPPGQPGLDDEEDEEEDWLGLLPLREVGSEPWRWVLSELLEDEPRSLPGQPRSDDD
jgi:hypothetical protein